MIMLGAGITAIVVFTVVRWPDRLVALMPLAMAAVLLGAFVNPVQIGLGDLRGSQTAQFMIAAGRDARHAGTLWASDTPAFDALMFATATPALSSRQQIGPDELEWRRLDPTGEHEDVWNRGGTYIRFTWDPGATGITWTNPTIDQIVMIASPCTIAGLEPRLAHIVSSRRLRLPCLTQVRRLTWSGAHQWVYAVDRT